MRSQCFIYVNFSAANEIPAAATSSSAGALSTDEAERNLPSNGNETIDEGGMNNEKIDDVLCHEQIVAKDAVDIENQRQLADDAALCVEVDHSMSIVVPGADENK